MTLVMVMEDCGDNLKHKNIFKKYIINKWLIKKIMQVIIKQ
jgi:hypothetical protein